MSGRCPSCVNVAPLKCLNVRPSNVYRLGPCSQGCPQKMWINRMRGGLLLVFSCFGGPSAGLPRGFWWIGPSNVNGAPPAPAPQMSTTAPQVSQLRKPSTGYPPAASAPQMSRRAVALLACSLFAALLIHERWPWPIAQCAVASITVDQAIGDPRLVDQAAAAQLVAR